MKKLISLFVIAILYLPALAQRSKPKMYLSPQASILVGEATSGQLLFSSGVHFKSLAVGAGAGVDFYTLRTVPVFLELHKGFRAGEKTIWVFGDGGLNLPALTSDQKSNGKDRWTVYQNEKFSSGYYMNGGIGVTLFEQKERQLLVLIGFGKKTMKQYYEQRVWMGPQTPVWEPHTFKYEFNRWLIRLAYRFR